MNIVYISEDWKSISSQRMSESDEVKVIMTPLEKKIQMVKEEIRMLTDKQKEEL